MLAQLNEDRSVLLKHTKRALGASLVACAEVGIAFFGGRKLLLQGNTVAVGLIYVRGSSICEISGRKAC